MDIIVDSFNAFIRNRFPNYRIGRDYYSGRSYPGDQDGQNPYIKTEADIQMKYGGFLEIMFLERNPELTVHAELPVYSNPRERADLTIHRIQGGKNWTSREQIHATLECVIEIKFANVGHPYFDFNNGGINKDIKLLESLRGDVKKYLIIVDEAELIDPNKVKQFIDDASASRIVILSNNTRLLEAT